MRQLISYFFGVFTTNSRGKDTGFKTGDEPNKARFQELFDSQLFPAEPEHRAKQSTGTEADIDLHGYTQIETDANAKNNVDGLQATTTKVVHAAQLPTVVAKDSSIVVTKSAELTRNEFEIQSVFPVVFSSTTIEIGDWNMDTLPGVTVAHGLSATEWKTVRGIDLIIRSDGDDLYYTYKTDELWIEEFASTLIALNRKTSGFFDNVEYDSTSYNRGWITLRYTAD